MTSPEERAELERLVQFIMAAQCTESEHDAALRELESRILHPRVSALIYWTASEGFDHELTAREVVDAALAYRPVEL
jgi:hypothetical protein